MAKTISPAAMMGARHFPKIRGGEPVPQWLVEHTDRNMHALGPTPEVLAEWRSAGLELPDLPAIRRYRLRRVREQLRGANCDGALLYDPLTKRPSARCRRRPGVRRCRQTPGTVEAGGMVGVESSHGLAGARQP